MGKIEILKSELAESQARCASLQEKCDHHKTEMFIVKSKLIRAEKQLAKLKMEITLLKEGIII